MTVRLVCPARVRGRIRAPPSKSYTHRALVAAFLADGECEVVRPLESDDTHATRDGLGSLGARIRNSRSGWFVSRARDSAPHLHRVVRCGESGTTLRFLAAVASLGTGPVTFEGAPRLASRPMNDLYQALCGLGATVHPRSRTRSLPCTVEGPIRAGSIAIRGDISSQFTSALLMVLPTVDGPSRLRIRGTEVSRPYVEATRAVLDERGIEFRRARGGFVIPGGQRYKSGRIRVPGDASSAAYLWAAAAATGGRVNVDGIPAGLPQADLAILRILRIMGSTVRRTGQAVRVEGPLSRPVSVDLTDSPDLFPLVAVLAAMVPGRQSVLRGAPHLAFKESNRRVQSMRLARAVGAHVTDRHSRLEVTGTASPQPLNLPELGDHRLVMSATVAGLAATGASRIGQAEAVSKSFPQFWTAIDQLTDGEGSHR